MAAALEGRGTLSPCVVSPEPGSVGPSRPAWMYQAHHMLEEDRRTKLSIACGLGDDAVVDELLSTGAASVSDRDVFDETCLRECCLYVCDLLVRANMLPPAKPAPCTDDETGCHTCHTPVCHTLPENQDRGSPSARPTFSS